MVEDKNIKQLAEVEYCLRKYYQENLSGILSKVVKDVKDKQQKEMLEISGRENAANAFIPASAQSLNIHNEAHRMPWGSRTTDDMIQIAVREMFKNSKTAHDLGIMAGVWRLRAIERLGVEKYQELSSGAATGDLAMDIVLSRLNDQMIDQMARCDLPSGTLDYIAKKGFEESLLGMASRVTQNLSLSDSQVKDMVEKMYGPSATTIFAGKALSFVIDAPTYFIGGGSARSLTLLAGADAAIKTYESYSEWQKSKEGTQKEFSKIFFGDENGMSNVTAESLKVKGGDSDTVSVINSKLNNKLRLPFNYQNAKSNIGQFIALCDGNGSYASELVTAFLSEKGLAYLPQKKVPEWMMRKCSEDMCIKNAGYYLSIADEMNKKGLSHIKVGSRDMTMKQVVQQAYDYSRAADLKHKTAPLSETDQLLERLNDNEAHMKSVGLLPEDRNEQPSDVSHSLILNQIRSALHKNGLAYVPDKPWPKWMDSMSQDKLEYEAKRWRNIAVRMQSQKKDEQVFKGVGRMTLQDVAQRSYDYSRAADAMIKDARQEIQRTRQMDDEWDRNMVAINAALETPQDRGQFQDPNIHQAVDTLTPEQQQEQFRTYYQERYQPSSVPQGQQPYQTTRKDIDGWGRLLEKSGLNGMGSLGSNLGSIIAMMPELMVGMFTGKITGFSLKDNAIPLAMLMMSILSGKRMNPLLKFMMLGLGGAMLLNNASKVVRGETSGEARAQKFYKRYEDEPLNPRLSNVAMKGNTILADIDGVPTILTIKSDRVLDAYNKGAIPLNTLCNAVLRRFDDMDVNIVQNYEQVAAQNQEEQQQQVKLR